MSVGRSKMQLPSSSASGETGIRLSKPERLLSEWTENYDLARSQRRDYFTLDRLERFEARLAERMSRTKRDYALTAFSAAARFAPAVRYQPVYADVADAPERLAQELELKPVESGANVTLIEYADIQCPACRNYTESLFPTVVDEYIRPGTINTEFRGFPFLGPDSLKGQRFLLAAA